jgi:hypothetical protein
MARQFHSHAERQQLASHAYVHGAFKHISEFKALAILALRPTTDEVDEAARRLEGAKHRTRSYCNAGVVAAIMGVLAGEAVV